MRKTAVIGFRIWMYTAFFLTLGFLAYALYLGRVEHVGIALLAGVGALVGSIPALIVLLIALYFIRKNGKTVSGIFTALHSANLFSCACYGIAFGFAYSFDENHFVFRHDFFEAAGIATAALYSCACLAVFIQRNNIKQQFGHLLANNQNKYMDSYPTEPSTVAPTERSNKIFLKGLLTAGLILGLLIPTLLINNLVEERQKRQEGITKEVSSKWASSQTLSGPYIHLPYKKYSSEYNGQKTVVTTEEILILPDNLNVTGQLDHELRQRSIYKVLLYRASLAEKGNIVIQIPKDIDSANIQWQSATLCIGLSDFKGIEERIVVKLNGVEHELSPGLLNVSGFSGLSAPITLSPDDLGKSFTFETNMKLKGSEELHFLPLAGNSSYILQSRWPSPSFDGNALPVEREVSDSGFRAKWTFNKANLPFPTSFINSGSDYSSIAFGITMLQPADGYSKTSRCIKYGILFIGLTLSLFFIIEVMQKKPLHPVQYVLIGLALVIFYTLLLSISEFIIFDYAYAIAAAATIFLISLYAKSHFKNWKSMALFASVLCALYTFIFVLIRLEDTALLIGSIGLFAILALVMFASRKINWYGVSN